MTEIMKSLYIHPVYQFWAAQTDESAIC